jgi:predicted transcriptional regulator
MPIEIRVMMYTDQEVVAALSAYFRRAGRPLTVGTIQNFRVEDEEVISVDLTVETVDGEIVTHKVAETDLAAALLMDAISRKVPLPAESNKRLYMVADHISLVIDQRRASADATQVTRQARRRGGVGPVG